MESAITIPLDPQTAQAYSAALAEEKAGRKVQERRMTPETPDQSSEGRIVALRS